MATVALIALTAVTAGVSAMGAMSAANAEANAAKYNASIAERNAQIAKNKGIADEAAKRRETRRMLGKQRAAIGASGLQAVGTPLLALEETAALGELDALTIRDNANKDQTSYKMDANLSRMRAKSAKRAGTLRAAGALLGGVGGAVKMAG